MPDLSLIFPVRNEAGNLEALYTRVRDALRQAQVSYELLFVDDGSTDRSLELIKELRARDGQVRYLSLSRSFGHQAALFAGLCAVRGRAVIMMDADLQHPPELIPEMIRLWREGYEVVYTTKRQQALPWWWRWQMQMFYAVVSKLCGLKLSPGQSDYRLLDCRVAEVLRSMPEYKKFLRGLVSWVGFKQYGIEYTLPARQEGRSQYIYRDRLELALDGIFAFSVVPLRLLLLFGLIVATLTFPYIVVIVVLGVGRWLGSPVYLPPGWATVAVSVLWLGSIQLIAIGILGEYIARIYDQTKARPAFIIREASDAGASSTMASSLLVEEA
ncbi:MAG: glycosyltransferase family 2 protein [Candidatus Omnitrophica bacterium]|nr:glycosyltransferase family 2 protein [Candidatus Omnitrophota bacterium]